MVYDRDSRYSHYPRDRDGSDRHSRDRHDERHSHTLPRREDNPPPKKAARRSEPAPENEKSSSARDKRATQNGSTPSIAKAAHPSPETAVKSGSMNTAVNDSEESKPDKPGETEKQRLIRQRLEAWKAKQTAKGAAATSSSSPSTPASTATTSSAPSIPAASSPAPNDKDSNDPSQAASIAAAAVSARLGLHTKASFPSTRPTNLPAKPAFNALGKDEKEDGDKKITMFRPEEGDTAQLRNIDPAVMDEDDDGEDVESEEQGPKVIARLKSERRKEEQKPAVEQKLDSDDPLDAFMNGITEQVKKVDQEDVARFGGDSKPRNLSERLEDESDDEMEGQEKDDLEKAGLKPEEILALAAKRLKKKELAPVDHSKIDYPPFRKAFYHPPPAIEEMTDEEAASLRLELDGIKIRGVNCPKPITKWSHCGLPAVCLDVIKQQGFESPTSIQAQAMPAIMSGRDVIGVAKTGSGKTLAFLLPLFRHIKDQPPLQILDGPIAIIMTPTRELAVQIHRECKPFLKQLNLRAICAYGGSPLKDNINDMKRGAEILVCTPGRMIELLSTNSGRLINLKRVTYLVLDEADRMFDMGFEPQVMKIVGQIRPDRQTVLFSATFPKQMEALARKILRKPLEITVGGRSVVAPEISQIVEVREESTKFNRLLEYLGRITNEDEDARVLIFVDRQESADNILRELSIKGHICMSLHGGKDQVDRDSTISDFKAGVTRIVIATSVAARGLDVKQLKLVINYDVPNHMEDYIHRAGRTGRAGNTGTCVTYITPSQDRYAVDIVRALSASGAEVPPELKTMSDEFLEKIKSGKEKASSSGFGGKGLDRLDQDRDAREKAERSAYGEPEEKGQEAGEEEGSKSAIDLPDIEVEVKKGPAPADATAKPKVDSSSSATPTEGASAVERAQAVAASLNASLRQKRMDMHDEQHDRRRDPDATDYHATIPINDYPQKARWRVTNKETMVSLIENTGASITNKGIFYEKGKDPGPDEPPKLHLLIESNDERKVRHAIAEIKRILFEASAAALEAEQRNPSAAGRYNVL